MIGIRATSLAVEMVGLTLSMVALILSLFIFCHFRNLWSTLTRLRKNLFISLGIQTIVRLIITVHSILRISTTSKLNNIIETSSRNGFQDPQSVSKVVAAAETELWAYNINHKNVHDCETFFPILLLEYSRTAMFIWMFLEELYLHSMITVFPIIQERISLKFYYIMGWICPILLTFIWVIMAIEKVNGQICWRNYMFTSYFWSLEGPKLTLILMTFLFQLNVIRILVSKLWRSNSPEVNQVRKAVSRSIVLVPLLGITNYLHLQMRHSPLDSTLFPSWSYSTALVTSFQGVFAALIYCFLSGEVQSSLRRWYIERRNEQREIVMVNGGPAGNCSISSINSSSNINPPPRNRNTNDHVNAARSNNNNHGKVGFGLFNWTRLKKHNNGACNNSATTNSTVNTINTTAMTTFTQEQASLLGSNVNSSGYQRESSPSPALSRNDPFKQHWNECDLSAHCNVDIENIEIPLDYIKNYNKKRQHGANKTGACATYVKYSDAAAAAATTSTISEIDSRRSSAYLVEIDPDLDVSSVDLKTEEDETEDYEIDKETAPIHKKK